ncbi:sensor histidine kinase [Tenacibaculum maritimum]
MRSQMNPHFIFNALNSVNNFIALNDERSANRYLSDFSKLMRSVLENSEEDFIPLSKEIALLRLYVKLEHDRFKDKFEYSLFIDEKIQQDQYLIPPMLLQPYIENAIWHGLRYKKSKGLLEVSMKQQKEGYVEIVIKDDGVGREKSTALKTKNQLKQKSKGMSTIKKRITILNEMYQDVIDVKVADLFKNGEGTEIKVILKKKRI